MRIAIIGTGAVGGYFGAKLAAAGHELVFIARGRHLEALRRDGLSIVSPSGNLFVRDAVFTASPEDVDAIDLVLFCVKSYDTDAAAQAFGSLIGDRPTRGTTATSAPMHVGSSLGGVQSWHRSAAFSI